MDDSLLELENELKRLRPRSPSANLLKRIEAGLASPEMPSAASRATPVPFPVKRFWLDWRIAAAAAAVAVFATVLVVQRRPNHGAVAPAALQPMAAVGKSAAPAVDLRIPAASSIEAAPAVDRYQPVGAASVLYDLEEDRVVTMPSSTPARRLRYRYVDTYTWKNPATNASLKWSVPRDEVRVLPASLH